MVRNCQDIGRNLQRIVIRMLQNTKLLKLLYYTDQDPLNQPDLTNAQKAQIFGRFINIVPRLPADDELISRVAITVLSGTENYDNPEFKDLVIAVDSYVPLDAWIIKNENLRPFLIMGEIQSSLKGLTIEGIGKLSGGDFEIKKVTDDIGIYRQTFTATTYD